MIIVRRFCFSSNRRPFALCKVWRHRSLGPYWSLVLMRSSHFICRASFVWLTCKILVIYDFTGCFCMLTWTISVNYACNLYDVRNKLHVISKMQYRLKDMFAMWSYMVQVGYEGRFQFFLFHNWHAWMQKCSIWELHMYTKNTTKYNSKYHKR